MAEIKSINGLAAASIKSRNGVLVASIKNVNGLTFPATGDFQTKCVSLDGSSEYFLNSTLQELGITNTWTIDIWTSFSSYTNYGNYVTIENGTNVNNAIYIGNYPTNKWIVDIYSSTGGEKYRTSSGTINGYSGTRLHLTATWDGSTINLYTNGSADNGTGSGTITQTATDRKISVGATTGAGNKNAANFSKVNIWNTALSSTEITALHDSGNGYKLDVRNSYGNYTSTSALKHQWAFGKDSGNIGTDYVSSGGIDLMADASNISSEDITDF